MIILIYINLHSRIFSEQYLTLSTVNFRVCDPTIIYIGDDRVNRFICL